MRTASRILFSALLCGLLGASPAAAEWYVSGYAGVSIPTDQDVDGNANAGGIVLLNGTFKDVDPNTSVVFGGKVGHFLESLPFLGLEVEGYHFSPDADSQTVQASGTILPGIFPIPVAGQVTLGNVDVGVTSIGLNAVFRLQLGESDAYPKGRFQPYAGAGLGIFFANLETTVVTAKNDDTDTAVGPQVLAGLKFFITEHLSLFGEYKFIHAPNFEFELSETVMGTPVNLKLETDITSHLFYGGIAYHF